MIFLRITQFVALFFVISGVCPAQTPYSVMRQANSSPSENENDSIGTARTLSPASAPERTFYHGGFNGRRGWYGDDTGTASSARRQGSNGTTSGFDPAWTRYLIKKEDRTYDFGTVAKGTRAEHRFVLTNAFDDDVHIASVASSCSCTTVSLLDDKNNLQTYEKATIVAQFRADLFDGSKNATITVVIDKPYYAEFQLNVRGEIRTDLTIRPDSVKFGNVKSGQEISRTIEIVYTGYDPSWKIVDFKSSNEHLSAKIEDVKSSYGLTTTKVRVVLDEKTPVGNFLDRLFLVTNDPGSRRDIPVLVQATVGTVINTPETVFFGYLEPGTASSRIVVVQGSKPFRITKISCDNPAVVTTFEPKEDAPPKVRYILPMRYLNPKDGDGAPKDGRMRAVVKIETDQDGLTPSFNVMMELAKKEPEDENSEGN